MYDPRNGGRELGSERLSYLDGLRGLAIALVLAWHFAFPFVEPQASLAAQMAFPFLSLAWTGVDLFFVLSGFLLGGQLLDHRESPRYFSSFYARRGLRILPLFYLWLGISLVVPAVLNSEAHPGLALLFHDLYPPLASVLFLQNIHMVQRDSFVPGGHWLSVTWSLAIEEQFYLLLPLLLRRASSRFLPAFLLAFVCVAPLARLAVPTTLAAFLLPFCRFDSLFLGVFCAWAVRHGRAKAILLKFSRALPLVALGTGSVLVIAAGLGHGLFSRAMNTWGLTCVALFYASLLLRLHLWPAGFLARLVRAWPLRILGVVSYGVFLMHTGVAAALSILFLGQLSPVVSGQGLLVLALSVAATIALAAAAHRFIELPVRRWKSRFPY